MSYLSNPPKSIIKSYGTGYYRATLLFPKKIREAIWILYSFVRIPDEIVDNSLDNAEALLNEWKSKWHSLIQSSIKTDNEIMNSFAVVAREYKIPNEYVDIFLDAMKQDLYKSRYATYKELEDYMHGSATVVGYMISHVIGFKDGALPYAKALAEAFQMTNFLRDIKSDYEERGRIYLPKEDLDRFGVTEDHISRGIVDESWKKLMHFEIERTYKLYDKGVKGISFLDKDGRRAVYASALVYKEILDLIEKSQYDIFSKRVVVSPFRKTVLIFKSLWYRNQ